MKMRHLLGVAAASVALALAVSASAKVQLIQKDNGGMCFDFLSGTTNTQAYCWDASAVLTIDDGVTAAPTIILQDGTDETVTIGKTDAGALTFTSSASGTNDGVQVLVGSLFVGNGTPGETINGEDLYVEGISEFDGTANFDGAVDIDGTLDFSGALSSNADVTILTPGDLIVGNGVPTLTQNGEDGYVEGTFEVDGAAQLDGAVTATSTLAVTSTSVFTGGVTHSSTTALAGAVTGTGNTMDVSLALPTNGGNADADNEFVGVPKIRGWTVGVSINGTAQVVSADYMDETPAGEWTGTTNVTDATDSTTWRKGSASLSLAVVDAAVAGNGADNTLTGGDQDWTADESFGFWHRCDLVTVAGDWVLEITDSVAGATTVNIPAVGSANHWEWIEVDVSGVADASKDVITTLAFDLSTAGAARSTMTCHFDYPWKWDAANEEAIGQDILEDGAIGMVWANVTASGSAFVPAMLAETTDYFFHYEAGNDFFIAVSDQSANAVWGMAAAE